MDFNRQRKRPDFKKWAYKNNDYTQNVNFHQDPCNYRNWVKGNQNYKFSKQLGPNFRAESKKKNLLYQLQNPRVDKVNLNKVIADFRMHQEESLQNHQMQHQIITQEDHLEEEALYKKRLSKINVELRTQINSVGRTINNMTDHFYKKNNIDMK